ncbi:hypothetical protein HYN59_14155 [Flavobacterium album]|uniref:Phage abortive infection protein n=1 Tax=Flavobacterium album TaxID=2175091 RepID=A0A2S1R0J6_9FLAO|nr:putative phage abortive infection protein [Flavobacterium album]AWH86180.1 hypothetical protein HYN59_14155 [Flavobacterium album]
MEANNTDEIKLYKLNYKAITMLILAFLALLFSFIAPYFFVKFSIIDLTDTGEIGDTLGGIMNPFIAIGGVLLTYLAFYMQFQANKLQREQFLKQLEEDKIQFKIELGEQQEQFKKTQFENQFYEMIRLHRENVDELNFNGEKLAENDDSLFIEKIVYEGKSVFKVIFNQFIICGNELSPFVKFNSVYIDDYKNKLLNEPYIKDNNISLALLAKIDICYSIVFYGLSAEGILVLKHIFKDKYRSDIIDLVINYLSLKPAFDEQIFTKWNIIKNAGTRTKKKKLVTAVYEWRKNRNIPNDSAYTEIENYHNRYIKYYGGHQFRIGHYYRHLYQMVSYVNNQTNIDYKEKYNYVKILRAQLSTYEQAIFFANSLSKMGESWEFKPEIDFDLKDFMKHDFELITKYNLIKNIPGDTIYGVNFKQFYPNIQYEGDSSAKKRVIYK